VADYVTFVCTGRGAHRPRRLARMKLDDEGNATFVSTPTRPTEAQRRRVRMKMENGEFVASATWTISVANKAGMGTFEWTCHICRRRLRRSGSVVAREWLTSGASTIDISTLT
jgi:hypothetical protein